MNTMYNCILTGTKIVLASVLLYSMLGCTNEFRGKVVAESCLTNPYEHKYTWSFIMQGKGKDDEPIIKQLCLHTECLSTDYTKICALDDYIAVEDSVIIRQTIGSKLGFTQPTIVKLD